MITRKLLCKLGFHKWNVTKGLGSKFDYKCVCCGIETEVEW